jgi:uncharacterized protein with gpF-like domain
MVDKKEGKKIYDMALELLVTMAEAAEPVIKRNLRETKAADMPSKAKLKKELNALFGEFEAIWVDEYTKTLALGVNAGYNQQLEFVFNEKDKDKIRVLRARGENKVRLILEERGLESFANISKTHTDRIMSAIVNGVKANETIQEITKRVAEQFADPKAMAAKAATIARTETLTAVSIGQQAALKNAAEVIPGLRKAWLNGNDARVRDDHLDVNEGGVSGQVVAVNAKFSNGLDGPRDLDADDPSQVINCRCTVVMLLPGEEL